MAEISPTANPTESQAETIRPDIGSEDRLSFSSEIPEPTSSPETSSVSFRQELRVIKRYYSRLKSFVESLLERSSVITNSDQRKKMAAALQESINAITDIQQRLSDSNPSVVKNFIKDATRIFAKMRKEISVVKTEIERREREQEELGRQPISEAEKTVETESAPIDEPSPPPPPAEVVIEGWQVLGALASEVSMSSDRALNERVQRYLDEFDRRYERDEQKAHNELQETHNGIVLTLARALNLENKTVQLDLAKAQAKLNEKLESLSTAKELEKSQFDEQVRKAIVKELVAHRTQEIQKRLRKQLDRINRENGGKGNLLRSALEIAGGTALGMAIRNLVVDSGIDAAGWWALDVGVGKATRTLSGGSAAIAGGVVGGALGALKAEREAMRRTYAYSNIEQRIKAEQERLVQEAKAMNRETPVINEAEILIRLIEQGDLRADNPGEIGAIREKIDEYYRLQAQQELETAIATAQRTEQSKNNRPEVNLARAYIALLDAHREGSEKNRTNAWDRCWQVLGFKQSANATEAFTTGLKRDVLKQTGWGALKGAVIGAGISGFIGAMWPPAKMFAKVGAEAAAHSPIFQEAAQALISGDANHAVEILVNKFKLDTFQGSERLFEGRNLFSWAQELVNKVGTDENGLRALHQLLSYPAETIQAANGIDQLVELIRNGGINGPDLTNGLLHGAAGVDKHSLATDLDTYLDRKGLAHWWFRGGVEMLPGTAFANNNWGDMVGFSLSSMVARYAASHQIGQDAANPWRNRLDWVKERFGAKEGGKKEEVVKEGDEKKKPDSIALGIDENLLNELEDNQNKRSERRKTFIKTMGAMHGKFFILPPKPEETEPRVFRIWTRDTDLANPYQEVGTERNAIHSERAQRDNRQGTGLGAGAADYDPDLIAQGKVRVVEYPTKVFAPYSKGASGTEFPPVGRSWDREVWQTQDLLKNNNNKRKIDVREIFKGEPGEDKTIWQSFIHPDEIELYLYAIKELDYPIGEPIKDGSGQIMKYEALKEWVHSRSALKADQHRRKQERIESIKRAQQETDARNVRLRAEAEERATQQ